MKLQLLKKPQNKRRENGNKGKSGIKPRAKKLRSIKARMIVMNGLLLLAVCVGFAVTAYINSSNALINQIRSTLPVVADQSAKVIESRVETQLEVLKNTAEENEIKDPDIPWEEKLLFLNKRAMEDGHTRMGIADLEGNLKSTNGEKSNIKDTEYFKQAVSGKSFVTEPIVSKTGGMTTVIYSVPIRNDNEITGVLVAVRNGFELNMFTKDINLGGMGCAFMLGKDGTTIAHEDIKLVMNMNNNSENVKKDPSLESLVSIEKRMVNGESGWGEYEYGGVVKLVGYAPIKLTGWSIGVEAPKSEILSGLNSLKFSIATMSAIFIILGLIFAYVIAVAVAVPVKASSDLLSNISTGDFTKEVPKKFLKRKDEFGVLANSIEIMQNSIRDVIHSVMDEAANVTQVIDNAISSISGLNEQIEDVSATTEEMSAGMEEMAASAEEMNATSSEIDRAVESIAAKAQDGAAAAESISEKAKTLRENFIASRDSAERIFVGVKEKLEKALAEAKAVEEINVLAEAILQITSQTNLLALNAAIEAARAGEAGRGFAVVADEIRKLAENSSKTVTQIQEITQTVIQSVENLSSSSNELLNFVASDVGRDYNTMLNATEEYNNDAESIAELVADFSATAEELAASMQNMIKAINEITASNSEAAEGTQNIAQKTTVVVEKSNDVLMQANITKESARKLNETVAKFKV